MFSSKIPTNQSGLESAIDQLLVEMARLDGGDDSTYDVLTTQLSKLYALKEIDHKVGSAKRVSPDTWAVVGANVLGILMIVGHERAHVVTSKALTLLSKIR